MQTALILETNYQRSMSYPVYIAYYVFYKDEGYLLGFVAKHTVGIVREVLLRGVTIPDKIMPITVKIDEERIVIPETQVFSGRLSIAGFQQYEVADAVIINTQEKT